jgi:hypothetical protein
MFDTAEVIFQGFKRLLNAAVQVSDLLDYGITNQKGS